MGARQGQEGEGRQKVDSEAMCGSWGHLLGAGELVCPVVQTSSSPNAMFRVVSNAKATNGPLLCGGSPSSWSRDRISSAKMQLAVCPAPALLVRKSLDRPSESGATAFFAISGTHTTCAVPPATFRGLLRSAYLPYGRGRGSCASRSRSAR